MKDYNKYLVDITKGWNCGHIMPRNNCVHVAAMALQSSSLLTAAEINAINGHLIRNMTKTK